MLKINDSLRIRKYDSKNLVIEGLKTVKRRKGGETQKWVILGYYGELNQALEGIINKKLFDCVEKELQIKDILREIEEIKKEIQKK